MPPLTWASEWLLHISPYHFTVILRAAAFHLGLGVSYLQFWAERSLEEPVDVENVLRKTLFGRHVMGLLCLRILCVWYLGYFSSFIFYHNFTNCNTNPYLICIEESIKFPHIKTLIGPCLNFPLICIKPQIKSRKYCLQDSNSH